jgi:two-component system, NarL family, sensor histidine kinase UhpB
LENMSLRTRLLTAIFMALLISFSLGTALAVWEAARSVHAEQEAALLNARQSTAAAMANLPEGQAGEDGMRRLVSAFDGSRHLQALLLGPDGARLAESQPAPAPATPAFLLTLIAPTLKPVSLPVKGQGGVVQFRLVSEPLNEAAERWSELRARIAGFGFFFILAAILCSLTATRSLRPLTQLSHGMARIGRGETAPALPQAGPSETAALARAFNTMADALRAAQSRNRKLERQITTIAEEERAEIARGLHDEVGPLLFAINTFAAAIGRQVRTNDMAPVAGQLDSIQQAVSRLQLQVRDMLGRLVQSEVAPADLASAVQELTTFWRSLRPEIIFTVAIDVPSQTLTESARECLFRAAQEGISNAVRHGNPGRITLAAQSANGWTTLRIADDGRGGPEGAGMGLPGMRARAAALGGHVTIEKSPGWTVIISIPFAQPEARTVILQGARA